MTFLRNFAVQSGLTGISRLLGVIRDMLLAARIGAGPVADAWFTALQLPNLFRRTLAEGAFSQAFVPLYTEMRERDGADAANRAAGQTLSVLFGLTLGLSLALQLAMPWVMLVLQAGYADTPEIFDLSILLARITMPYLTGMACAALFAGILNAHGRFTASALAPTLFNLCLIGAALSISDPVYCAIAASIAVTLSGLLQALMLWRAAFHAGVQLPFVWPSLTKPVRRIITLALPGAIATSATQINIIISQSLASLEHGAKSWLAFADRLYQLPLGLIGVAIGVTLLPRLSNPTSSPQDQIRLLNQALMLGLGLVLPAAVALMILPDMLIHGLFGRGAFTPDDTRMTAAALWHFAWGAPAFVLIKLLASVFFARQDTRSPMRFALVSVACNIALGAGMFFYLRRLGLPAFPGLAMATSIAAWLNAGLLALSLFRQDLYRPGVWLVRGLVKIGMATALMAVCLVWLKAEEATILRWVFDSKLLAMSLVILVGLLVYCAASIALGTVRPAQVRANFRPQK